MRERLLAHFETSASLAAFLRFAKDKLNAANPSAFIALIHDPAETERLRNAVQSVGLRVRHVRYMVHSRGQPCTRVLVQLKLCDDHDAQCANLRLQATLPRCNCTPRRTCTICIRRK